MTEVWVLLALGAVVIVAVLQYMLGVHHGYALARSEAQQRCPQPRSSGPDVLVVPEPATLRHELRVGSGRGVTSAGRT